MKKLLLLTTIMLLTLVSCSKKETKLEVLSTSDSLNIAKVDTLKAEAVVDTVKKQ